METRQKNEEEDTPVALIGGADPLLALLLQVARTIGTKKVRRQQSKRQICALPVLPLQLRPVQVQGPLLCALGQLCSLHEVAKHDIVGAHGAVGIQRRLPCAVQRCLLLACRLFRQELAQEVDLRHGGVPVLAHFALRGGGARREEIISRVKRNGRRLFPA